MIHICTNCYKTFKTIQHLNQHKNRKHKCKPFTENMSSIQLKTLSESKNDSNKLETGVLSGNHSNNHNSGEITDDEISLVKSNISSLESSPILGNKDFNTSIENLSITNLLEFVNTHKKILEEKNKLETTLVILKKHLETLTSENNELKNKMSIVNDFISVYRTPSSDSKKKPISG
jgi:hypothetical protein